MTTKKSYRKPNQFRAIAFQWCMTSTEGLKSSLSPFLFLSLSCSFALPCDPGEFESWAISSRFPGVSRREAFDNLRRNRSFIFHKLVRMTETRICRARGCPAKQSRIVGQWARGRNDDLIGTSRRVCRPTFGRIKHAASRDESRARVCHAARL